MTTTTTTTTNHRVMTAKKIPPSERLSIVIDRVIKNVNSVVTLPFKQTIRRKVATLTACVDGVCTEKGDPFTAIMMKHVCPTQWTLDVDNVHYAPCVEAVSYCIPTRQLRIKLVDRMEGQCADMAAARLWEDIPPTASAVNIRSINVTLQGAECVAHDPQLQDFATLLAHVAIAKATARTNMLSAKVIKYGADLPGVPSTSTNNNNTSKPEYVVSVQGLETVGPACMDPRYWSDVIPPSLCALLVAIIRTDAGEYRMAITGDAIAALKTYYAQHPQAPLLFAAMHNSIMNPANNDVNQQTVDLKRTKL
jgi:hypothetical protein